MRRKLEMKEIQSIELEILNYIDGICKKHNITYYLAYGTALGAVRHNGFIPWDDDIDICMERSEYEKFKNVLEETNKSERFVLLDVENSDSYFLPMPKVVDTQTEVEWHVVREKETTGIWVDIFPLDKVPTNTLIKHTYLSFLDVIQKLYEMSLYKTSISNVIRSPKLLLLSFAKLLNPKMFSKILFKLSKWYNKSDSPFFATLIFTSYRRRKVILDKKVYGKGVEYFFEGKKYLIPEMYDAYLRHFYRDYMQLPSEEKRVSNHTISVYSLD